MADFDLLKVKVEFRFFFILGKAPPLTKQRRLKYRASKSVQPFMAVPVSKSIISLKKIKMKKRKPLYVGYMYLSP